MSKILTSLLLSLSFAWCCWGQQEKTAPMVFFNQSAYNGHCYKIIGPEELPDTSRADGLTALDIFKNTTLPCCQWQDKLVVCVPLEACSGRGVRLETGRKPELLDKTALSLVTTPNGDIVARNQYYAAIFSKADGFALTSLRDVESGRAVEGKMLSPRLTPRQPLPPFAAADAPLARLWQAQAKDVTAEITMDSPLMAKATFRWERPGFSVIENLVFYHARRDFDVTYEVKWTKPLEALAVCSAIDAPGSSDVVFNPDDNIQAGPVPSLYQSRGFPTWTAFDKFNNVGFGMVATAAEGASDASISLSGTPGTATLDIFAPPPGQAQGKASLALHPYVCSNLYEVDVVSNQLAYPPCHVGNGFVFPERLLSAELPVIVGRPEKVVFTFLNTSIKWEGVVAELSSQNGWKEKRRFELAPEAADTFIFSPPADNLGSQFTLSVNNLSIPMPRLSPAPVVDIRGVFPEKLICAPDSDNSFLVKLKSNSPDPEQVRLDFSLVSGPGKKELLVTRNIEFSPEEQKEGLLKWALGGRRDGFEILVEAIDQGHVVASDREFFVSSDKFYQVGQMTSFSSMPGKPAANSDANWIVGNAKRAYASIIEFDAWDDTLFDVIPNGVEYYYAKKNNPDASYQAKLSPSWVPDFNRAAQKAGLKVTARMSTAASLDGAQTYPLLVRYNINGQPDFRQPNAINSYFKDKAAILKFADNTAKNLGIFHWDGARFDRCPFDLFDDSANPGRHRSPSSGQYEFSGSPLPPPDASTDKAGARHAALWLKAVRETSPGFMLAIDARTTFKTDSERVEIFPATPGPYRFGSDKDIAETLRATLKGSMLRLAHAVDVAPDGKWPTWDLWARALYVNRRFFESYGCFLYAGPMPSMPSVSTRTAMNLLTASEYHVWQKVGQRRLPNEGDEIFQANRYATRFCEYLYADNLKTLETTQEQIAISSPSARVLWKYFVYRRDFPEPDSRVQLVANLVNLPVGDMVYARHEEPVPVDGVTASFQIPEGHKFSAVYANFPSPMPHSEKLDATATANFIQVKLPRLVSVMNVVAEFTPVEE